MKIKLLACTIVFSSMATLALAQDAASTPYRTDTSPTVETAPVPEETPTPAPVVKPMPAAATVAAPKEEQQARPAATASPSAAARTPAPATAPTRKPTPNPSPKPAEKPEPPAPFNARDDSGGAGNVLKALEKEWEASIIKHDPSVIERLVADDFIGVSSAGKIGDKVTLLYESKRDKNVYKIATARQMSVHTYGSNVAVVLGITKETGTDSAGRAFDHTYRFTDTWMQRGGKWQCIAAHAAVAARR